MINLREQLNTWWYVMKPLIEQNPAWDNLFAMLKKTTMEGKTVCPASKDLLKSFELCDRLKVKAIVILQCPYATFREKTMIANGIPLDCSNITPYEQPSLYHWNQALEKTYGFHPDNDLRLDLSYLLQEEHVMLINSSWTVERDKVDSHAQYYEPIMKWLIEQVFNYIPGVPVVLVGAQAQRLEKYFNPLAHHILRVEHPASSAYGNREWKYGNLFNWCNQIIVGNNGPGSEIKWLRQKGEAVTSHKKAEYVPDASLGLPF